jgi:hypothetical protein
MREEDLASTTTDSDIDAMFVDLMLGKPEKLQEEEGALPIII